MTTSATPIGTGTSQSTATLSTLSSLSSIPSTSYAAPRSTYPTSTLPSTATIFPSLPGYNCGNGFVTIPSLNPACALLTSNQSAALMLQCCNGADRVVYGGGCGIYCDAVGQTLTQLNDCLRSGINGSGVGWSGQLGGSLCNRGGSGSSSSSPSSTSAGQPSSTSVPGVAAGRLRASGLFGGAVDSHQYSRISLMGRGTIAVLAVSGFAGLMV